MTERLIVSLDVIERMLEPQIKALRKDGIDTQGLLRYSFSGVANQDFQSVRRYIAKDLYEVRPELTEDVYNYRRVLHQCFDYVMSASRLLIPTFNSVYRGPNTGFEFDRFLGKDIVVRLTHSL